MVISTTHSFYRLRLAQLLHGTRQYPVASQPRTATTEIRISPAAGVQPRFRHSRYRGFAAQSLRSTHRAFSTCRFGNLTSELTSLRQVKRGTLQSCHVSVSLCWRLAQTRTLFSRVRMACHARCTPGSVIQGIHINTCEKNPHAPLPVQLKTVLLPKTRTGTSAFAALKHDIFRESSVTRRKIICFAQPSDSDRDPLSSDITPPTAGASLPVKLAWYGSEVFGRAVALFRGNSEEDKVVDDEFGAVVDLDVAREALKQDYARNYFVTGEMLAP